MKSTRIMLVDDHAAVRLGLRTLLETQPSWKVCGETANGRDALRMVEELRPDILILDITLPELTGFEVIRQVQKASTETEVIIFTGHSREDLVIQAFDAGARSFILKIDESAELLAAVRAAAEHRPYFTPWTSAIAFTRFQGHGRKEAPAEPGSLLSARESEAIKFIAEGKTNKELATQLGVSLRTAEGYRAAVMRKLGLNTLGELIRYAIRNGIIEP